MRQILLSHPYAFCIALFVTEAQAATHVHGESLVAQQMRSPPITTAQSPTAASVVQSPQATSGQNQSSELANLEAKVRPSVIWVSTFDSKGNLVRTESGFFISPDGKFVTTAQAVEG